MNTLRTRLLEQKSVQRATVDRFTAADATPCGVRFTTESVVALLRDVWSGDPDMVRLAADAREGEREAGTFQLDAVTDQIIRVRFALGDRYPKDDRSEMIASLPPGIEPRRCESRNGSYVFETAALRVSCRAEPFRIEISDLNGGPICGIGGPEKDQFCRWDAYNTGVNRSLDGSVALATECFDLGPGECIYGFGEKFSRLDKVGQTLDLINVDGLGTITPRTYKNIPFFVSTHGYGVFFHHRSLMTAWVGSMSSADVQIGIEDDYLDYFVITGSIGEVLHRYTSLTGRGCLPPRWSFGFWQSKFTYHSAEETIEIARKLREHGVPADVLHLDTDWFAKDWHCDLEFDPVDFPDPTAYFAEMARLGFKVSLWHMPYIREPSALFDRIAAVNGFVGAPDGGILDFEPAVGSGGRVGVIDFGNPQAVAIYREAIMRLLRLGARCMKTDFGEAVPLDGIYADGEDGAHNRNIYSLRYNRVAFEATEEHFGAGEGIVWARSAWAGSQRYPVHWGGDVAMNWHNLGPELAAGLSFGLSGFQFWSHDIAGFLGRDRDDELLVRWYQFGMFNSHARTHGVGDREIYRLDDDVFALCRDAIKLRYRLLPYIWGSAKRSVEESVPVMCPMVVEYQDDPSTWHLDDQYLFGPSLLVAPFLVPGGSRRVYLPAGSWADWFTGECVCGGRWIDVVGMPLDRLPLYVKEGAIIPMQPVMDYVDQRRVDDLTIRVFPFDGDGESRFAASVNGEWNTFHYCAVDGQHTLTTDCPVAQITIEPLGDSGARISLERGR